MTLERRLPDGQAGDTEALRLKAKYLDPER
jgi:hypothetical protein